MHCARSMLSRAASLSAVTFILAYFARSATFLAALDWPGLKVPGPKLASLNINSLRPHLFLKVEKFTPTPFSQDTALVRDALRAGSRISRSERATQAAQPVALFHDARVATHEHHVPYGTACACRRSVGLPCGRTAFCGRKTVFRIRERRAAAAPNPPPPAAAGAPQRFDSVQWVRKL